ncbi:MAG TPA: hypothetical protein DIT32_06960 [Peptococcaceae bacterium]|nr:hypothetical protein [Peptococcaceae bacterium]
MKLSQREKILLSVLGMFALLWLFYSFVFTPQYTALQESKVELEELQKKVEDIELYNDPNGVIQKRYQDNEKTIAAATAKYFPEILQERQIRILDQMLVASTLKGNVLSFSEIAPLLILEKGNEEEKSKKTGKDTKPFVLQELVKQMDQDRVQDEKKPEFTGSGVVETLQTQVEFTGTYSQFTSFIKAVESYPKKILISNIFVANGRAANTNEPIAAGEITGMITLQFYGIPKMHPDQDQDYTTWDIYDVYGRANPYLP